MSIAYAVSTLVVAFSVSTLLLTLSRVIYLRSRALPLPAHEPSAQEIAESVIGMPASLVEYIDQESEEWAREELRQEAVTIQKIYKDWESTERELKRRYAKFDMSAEEAANRAWQTKPQEVRDIIDEYAGV